MKRSLQKKEKKQANYGKSEQLEKLTEKQKLIKKSNTQGK